MQGNYLNYFLANVTQKQIELLEFISTIDDPNMKGDLSFDMNSTHIKYSVKENISRADVTKLIRKYVGVLIETRNLIDLDLGLAFNNVADSMDRGQSFPDAIKGELRKQGVDDPDINQAIDKIGQESGLTLEEIIKLILLKKKDFAKIDPTADEKRIAETIIGLCSLSLKVTLGDSIKVESGASLEIGKLKDLLASLQLEDKDTQQFIESLLNFCTQKGLEVSAKQHTENQKAEQSLTGKVSLGKLEEFLSSISPDETAAALPPALAAPVKKEVVETKTDQVVKEAPPDTLKRIFNDAREALRDNTKIAQFLKSVGIEDEPTTKLIAKAFSEGITLQELHSLVVSNGLDLPTISDDTNGSVKYSYDQGSDSITVEAKADSSRKFMSDVIKAIFMAHIKQQTSYGSESRLDEQKLAPVA